MASMLKNRFKAILFCGLVFTPWLVKSPLSAQPEPGAITTLAGGTSASYGGDNGPAVQAELFWPAGVFVDPWNNYYIADFGNARIRKVDAGGTITTLAGNGLPDFSGDGDLAVAAGLFTPSGMFVDDLSNLYLTDSGHNRIRWVHGQTGIITTIAGNGQFGFGTDGVPAINTSLSEPADVFVVGSGTPAGPLRHHPYGGTIYISDTLNHRIRKVDTKGTISTIAGNETEGFSGDGDAATHASLHSPGGIYVDKSGNLYISDTLNHRIRKVDTKGTISTIAGNGTEGFSGDGGPATLASLLKPWDVTVDQEGNIYIADTFNHRIRRVDIQLGVITTVAGSGPTGEDKGDYSGDGGPATRARLWRPRGICVDQSGKNLYIADTLNHRIRLVRLPSDPLTPSPDFDGNGIVNFQDFVNFARHFGAKKDDATYNVKFDLDLNGEIGFSDFVTFAIRFGETIHT